MTAPPTAFKVIIVGGGPVGLLTAHALHKADIDFILLERRNTCQTAQGSSIGLFPPTLRVLDQLGLYDAIMETNHKLVHKYVVTEEGKLFADMEIGTWIEECHGHGPLFIHRSDLLDLLYNTLPEQAKAKVLTNKRISGIESDEMKAVVTCEDGTSYAGNLVLGADGVHSQVRDYIRTLALAQDPAAKVDKEQPFLTTYRCLFGFGPTPEGLIVGQTWECHATDKSTQTFVGRDKTWFFVYEKLSNPTREKSTYTDEDKEEYIGRLEHLPISETVRVRDVYQKATQTVLVDLQEGTVSNYSWGRLVLAGDAANKHTPNAGNGFNGGVQDVVVLVNQLHGLVKGTKDQEAVSMAAVQALLGEYQTQRRPQALVVQGRSQLTTRMAAFEKWQLWLMDRYIVPGLKLDKLLFEKVIAPAAAASEVLSYLPETHLKHGKTPWKNMPAVEAIKV
ncbi:FAD dependent monooxygenase [Microdochium nivale]|nr:FAD dependent monooxygenase [Microdochium nivale]